VFGSNGSSICSTIDGLTVDGLITDGVAADGSASREGEDEGEGARPCDGRDAARHERDGHQPDEESARRGIPHTDHRTQAPGKTLSIVCFDRPTCVVGDRSGCGRRRIASVH